MSDHLANFPPELALPFQVQGKVLVYFGLTVTLYLRTNFANLNANLLTCIKEFLALAPVPTIGGFSYSGREKRFAKNTRKEDLTPFETRIKAGKSWDLYYAWAEEIEQAGPWSLELICPDWVLPHDIGYLHVTFPLEYYSDLRVPSLLREWSDKLQVEHGYAGLGFSLPEDPESASKADTIVYEIAQRFPGINVDYPLGQSTQLLAGFKTIDWLTILGREYTTKLGGAAKLQSALGERFHIDQLASGGTFIQAGDAPQVGGGLPDPRPPLYAELNRVLKPVRVQKLKYEFQKGHYTTPFFDLAASQKWIERLDDK